MPRLRLLRLPLARARTDTGQPTAPLRGSWTLNILPDIPSPLGRGVMVLYGRTNSHGGSRLMKGDRTRRVGLWRRSLDFSCAVGQLRRFATTGWLLGWIEEAVTRRYPELAAATDVFTSSRTHRIAYRDLR